MTMAQAVQEHPSAEELTGLVLDRSDTHLDVHLAECPSCARYVRELRMVRDSIASLPEYEVPASVERRVMQHQAPHAVRRPGLWGRFGEWYRNPLLIGLAVVLASIFFYVFFVFVLE